MNPVVAIPVRNRLDLTKPLVEELAAQGNVVIVYDNGSTDGTAEWLRDEAPGNKVVAMESPDYTLHEMWNEAIDVALTERTHLVLLNNDLILDGKPDWIGRLCAPFKAEEEWDALCPNYDRSPVVKWRHVVTLKGIAAGKTDGGGGLAGFAFAISNRFLKTGYRFPTDLKWWYGDNDLVMTLDAQQRPYGMVAGVGVEHIGGGSQTAKDHDLKDAMEADRITFETKWAVLLA